MGAVYDHARISAVYYGSDGDATKALYFDLMESFDVAGVVAVNLVRACKASERAKLYAKARGTRRYKGQTYDKKDWSIENLCRALTVNATGIGIAAWGWAYDAKAVAYEHVLYVELPTGQVSFHCPHRHLGPDYTKPWDGQKESAARILRWVASLYGDVMAKAAE